MLPAASNHNGIQASPFTSHFRILPPDLKNAALCSTQAVFEHRTFCMHPANALVLPCSCLGFQEGVAKLNIKRHWYKMAGNQELDQALEVPPGELSLIHI